MLCTSPSKLNIFKIIVIAIGVVLLYSLLLVFFRHTRTNKEENVSRIEHIATRTNKEENISHVVEQHIAKIQDYELFLNYSGKTFTAKEFEDAHQYPTNEQVMAQNNTPDLYRGLIDVDNQVNRILSISNNQELDFTKIDEYREKILEFFEKEFVWKGPLNKFQATESPFESLVVPTDYFLENYKTYSKYVLPYKEVYMIRFKNIHWIVDNTHSQTLESLARHLLGEECWNKKLVFLQDTFHVHKGGPRKVSAYLMGALKLIGKKFYHTQDYNSADILDADTLYSYGPTEYESMIPKLLKTKKDGFKYFIGPTIAKDIIGGHYSKLGDAVRVLSASHWVKYHDYGPILTSMKFLVYPTPMNTKVWSPKPSHLPPNMDGLFYSKGCYLNSAIIKEKVNFYMNQNRYFSNSTFHSMGYGGYGEPEFWNTLRNNIRFVVVCDDTETQGIALEEIMSMNIPLFVLWNNGEAAKRFREADTPTSVPYFAQGKTGVLTTMEEFDKEFPKFLLKVEKNEFTPRKFIVKTLNYFDMAVSFLNMTCVLQTPFEPREEYLKKFVEN